MRRYCYLLLCLCVLLCTACGQSASAQTQQSAPVRGQQDQPDAQGKAESPEQKASPAREAQAVVRKPEAPGNTVYEAENVTVDVSNASEGYFVVKYTGTVPKVRVQVIAPDGTKNQPLLTMDGEEKVFPLAGGDGSYQINILENTTGSTYAILLSFTLEVALKDEYTPFLYPNQYVDFDEETKAVELAQELSEGAASDLEVIERIYDYVIQNIVYDEEKAKTVRDGYGPVVDETLSTGKGICFDYAALMTAMMRTQRIPARLDIGYSGEIKHAWISAYTPETGWVDKIIEFDGVSWTLMDPTFAASARRKSPDNRYTGDGTNYTLQYSY